MWGHDEEAAVCNPLAVCGLWLVDGHLLGLHLPDGVAALETLPARGKEGDMGAAQLPSREGEPELRGGVLASFLAEHGLAPTGDPATLSKRAWKLQQALATNQELLPADLAPIGRREALQMLLEVADVFCVDIEDLRTPAKGEPFEINTGDAPPIKQRPYRLGEKEQQFLDKTIASQMRGGIVKCSRSPWASPVFVTYARALNSGKPPKPRKVIDYRRLNAITVSDAYPLPDIPLTLEWLAQYKYMGAIDLKSGYWQKEVHQQDQKKTAFVTPRSVLEYCRVPFGLKNAPAYFQREINKMLTTEDQVHARGFIDDLLTGGSDWAEYLRNQRSLLEACRRHGWMVTVSKVRLGYESICVLGHKVHHGLVMPDPDKIAAIKGLKAPSNIREVRAVLGLMGYYRRFIKDYAQHAKPLTQLLGKDSEWRWGQSQQEALDTLKERLGAAVMLTRPQSSGRYRLYTDWSKDALGACLH